MNNSESQSSPSVSVAVSSMARLGSNVLSIISTALPEAFAPIRAHELALLAMRRIVRIIRKILEFLALRGGALGTAEGEQLLGWYLVDAAIRILNLLTRWSDPSAVVPPGLSENQ